MANEVDRSIFVIKVIRAGFKLAVSQRERERERGRTMTTAPSCLSF